MSGAFDRRRFLRLSALAAAGTAVRPRPAGSTPRGPAAAEGHSETRVAKILGGNFARLFKEVWRAA